MTGWRIGFAVGNKNVLAGLGRVKSQLDSGVFEAVQAAGITALGLDDSVTDELRKIYQERRDTLVPGLKKLGLEVDPPPAAFYIWVTVPKGYTSAPSRPTSWRRPVSSRHRERVRCPGRRLHSHDGLYDEGTTGGSSRANQESRILRQT
jgi:aspartate/methionine/tyrosine aminotransferase